MYFWRIEKLKTEMVARPRPEREVLPYLVVYVGLYAAVGLIPQTLSNVWDWLGAVWSVVLAVVGTIYIYRRNGGSQGQHFLQRYFVVGWVVTIRWLVIIIPALLVFFAALSGVGIETEETAWYEFVFAGLAEAVVYWRIGHHVGDLANRTRPG